jgi:hypothetical protein
MLIENTRARGFRALLYVLAAAVAPLLFGCSGGDPTSLPVDAPRAIEVLKTTLEAWKKGQAIDRLKSASPPILAQDADWIGGSKLLNYQVEGEGTQNDLSLRVPVKLTLKPPQGAEVKKSVHYVVGTSPTLTVFREFP